MKKNFLAIIVVMITSLSCNQNTISVDIGGQVTDVNIEWNSFTAIIYYADYNHFYISTCYKPSEYEVLDKLYSVYISNQIAYFTKDKIVNIQNLNEIELFNEYYYKVGSYNKIRFYLNEDEDIHSGIFLSENIALFSITSNDESNGYLVTFDGSVLKRYDFSYNGLNVDPNIETSLYYDAEYNSVYFQGSFNTYMENIQKDKNCIYKYDFSRNQLTMLYEGNQPNDIYRIPNSDYLIFWDSGIKIMKIR